MHKLKTMPNIQYFDLNLQTLVFSIVVGSIAELGLVLQLWIVHSKLLFNYYSQQLSS